VWVRKKKKKAGLTCLVAQKSKRTCDLEAPFRGLLVSLSPEGGKKTNIVKKGAASEEELAGGKKKRGVLFLRESKQENVKKKGRSGSKQLVPKGKGRPKGGKKWEDLAHRGGAEKKKA